MAFINKGSISIVFWASLTSVGQSPSRFSSGAQNVLE